TSGVMIGWAVENAPNESLGAGGWLRTLGMLSVAAAAPFAGAAALMRGVKIPAFARVLAPANRWPSGVLERALGGALIALTLVAAELALGLVFDPRYRDFPVPPLTGATV